MKSSTKLPRNFIRFYLENINYINGVIFDPQIKLLIFTRFLNHQNKSNKFYLKSKGNFLSNSKTIFNRTPTSSRNDPGTYNIIKGTSCNTILYLLWYDLERETIISLLWYPSHREFFDNMNLRIKKSMLYMFKNN